MAHGLFPPGSMFSTSVTEWTELRSHALSRPRRAQQFVCVCVVQVHVFCKYLSRPILSHTLMPARMPPSSSYFTLTTAWKPNSTHILASLSTGSCHILCMGNDSDS